MVSNGDLEQSTSVLQLERVVATAQGLEITIQGAKSAKISPRSTELAHRKDLTSQ